MHRVYQSGSYAMDEPLYFGWTKERMVEHALGDVLHQAGVSAMFQASRDDGEVNIPTTIRVEVFDEDVYDIHVRLHTEKEEGNDLAEQVSIGDTRPDLLDESTGH